MKTKTKKKAKTKPKTRTFLVPVAWEKIGGAWVEAVDAEEAKEKVQNFECEFDEDGASIMHLEIRGEPREEV